MSTMTTDAATRLDDELEVEYFDVEKFQAEHEQPSKAESAFLTIVMFGGLLVFAVGCWAIRALM